MSKDHEGDSKQYAILSEAWYGEANLKRPAHLPTKQWLKIIENVQFGFYSPDGGSSGEMGMNWYDLSRPYIEGEKLIAPCLECWDDAWHALWQFRDVLEALAEINDRNITPKQFCEILDHCGFVDATEREYRDS